MLQMSREIYATPEHERFGSFRREIRRRRRIGEFSTTIAEPLRSDPKNLSIAVGTSER